MSEKELRQRINENDPLALLGKAAENGSAEVQRRLGQMYYSGWKLAPDYSEAAKWFRKAAEQGDAYARCCLGDAYRIGRGVEQDYAEAVKWYHKAAEQSDEIAQYNLGELYEFGKGVSQDMDEAKRWFAMAAVQNCEEAVKVLDIVFDRCDIEAMYERGNAYMTGDAFQNIKQKDTMAEAWYRRAADRGHARAAERLAELHGKFD